MADRCCRYTYAMLNSLGHSDQPKTTFSNLSEGLWHFSFDHIPDYLSDSNVISLSAFVEKRDNAYAMCVTNTSFEMEAVLEETNLEGLASKLGIPYLQVSKPWPLEVVRVEKPWGAEIWYTGIEQRGVCTAGGIPLPWLLDCLPTEHIGSATERNPLLLKILDPLPNPDLGDLYFELHDQKIEVYVITHVDTKVWPNGVGKIRYGFNQDVRRNYDSDSEFKSAYLQAVTEYQNCRNQIDQLLDQNKAAAGIALNDPTPSNLMDQWLVAVPSHLNEQEKALKEAMEAFTYFKDIAVGDVIKVEPYFPHSLQHGVRVIEFQTASYERYILSFGQKVLTQSHWDTAEALDKAVLDTPPETPMIQQQIASGGKLEVIADFSAFTAQRLSLEADSEYQLPNSNDYCIVICASGEVEIGNQTLGQEQAILIPANLESGDRVVRSKSRAITIIAYPKSS